MLYYSCGVLTKEGRRMNKDAVTVFQQVRKSTDTFTQRVRPSPVPLKAKHFELHMLSEKCCMSKV